VRGRERLRAREAAKQVQGVRGLGHLRAREAAKPVQGVRGLGHLRAREAAKLLQGVRGLSDLRAREAAKQVQGVPRRLTCCVFGNVFNTTGRNVSHPSLACPRASASRRFATRWSAKPTCSPLADLSASRQSRLRAQKKPLSVRQSRGQSRRIHLPRHFRWT